ncbi:MAG: hydroxyacylglutathione hydrolase C-terminal domain-containing protein, partial [Polyangiaceae bacterium]
DTLFLGGCGRMFEGTPPMMSASLAKLGALPPDTRVYCGHEYTESNLKFAAHVEPDNARIDARKGKPIPTVPGTIGEELATNPFLRLRSATIRKTLAIPADASDALIIGGVPSNIRPHPPRKRVSPVKTALSPRFSSVTR